ncbi:MAG TPA: S41 family peptidase, partial [Candidatus Paceibacterota bacterium]|nr:S41 family peptidase [Candidatus Paceibacterota bacterium]
MTSQKWKAAGVIIALLAAFYIGTIVREQSAFAQVTHAITGQAPAGIDMSQFWAAYQILNENFVVTHASSTFPNQQDQIYGAIAGLTSSFGDPYTTFFPPSDAQVFQEDIAGSFGGIGLQIDNNAQGQLVAVSALKDTPAQRAGIQTGDIILAIGTTSAQMLASDQAVKIIRGPVGTAVTLTLQRKDVQKPIVVTLTRETINIPIINTKKMDGGIFVISLYSFSENSADLFRDALRQFMQSGDSKLVLDLRGNPGGYLDAAVQMASYFLPVGDIIVTEDYKGKQENDVHRSLGYNIFKNDPSFKMAILID